MEVLPPVAKKLLWLGAIFMNASSRLQIISSQGKTFCAFQKVHLIVTWSQEMMAVGNCILLKLQSKLLIPDTKN